MEIEKGIAKPNYHSENKKPCISSELEWILKMEIGDSFFIPRFDRGDDRGSLAKELKNVLYAMQKINFKPSIARVRTGYAIHTKKHKASAGFRVWRDA